MMTEFDEWYSENTDGLHGDEHQAYNHARRAWNEAINRCKDQYLKEDKYDVIESKLNEFDDLKHD